MVEATIEVATRRGVLHPAAAMGRSWRRLRRRPRAMQIRTALIVVAIVVALIAWLMLAPSGTPGRGWRRGRCRGGNTSQLRPIELDADARESGQHEHPRGDQDLDQRCLPGGRHQQPRRQGGLRRGQGVQRAGPRHPSLRQPDQQRGGHQRAQDQPHHRAVRSHERCQHAVALRAVDAGQSGHLRGGRRHRHVGGDEPAVRDPTGPHAAHQRLVHRKRLDESGFALPVVDGSRHVSRPRGDGAVGTEFGSARTRQEGRRRRLRPGG